MRLSCRVDGKQNGTSAAILKEKANLSLTSRFTITFG
ncbi:unnamed protein product [Brassica rapa subsp. trilocularis]